MSENYGSHSILNVTKLHLFYVNKALVLLKKDMKRMYSRTSKKSFDPPSYSTCNLKSFIAFVFHNFQILFFTILHNSLHTKISAYLNECQRIRVT